MKWSRFKVLCNIPAVRKIIVLLLTLVTFIHIGSVVVLKNDSRGVEGNVLYTIERILLENTDLYTDPAGFPHSITQYSPMYYMLADALLSVSGQLHNWNDYSIRIFVRLLSFLLLIITIIYVIKIVELINGKGFYKPYFLLLIALVLINGTFPWYTITRPDILVTLSFILTIYFVVKNLKSGKQKYLLLAGIVSIIAPLAKQNGIIVYPIVFGFYAIRLAFKSSLLYLVSGLGACVVFSIIYIFFGYPIQFLFENLFIGVQNGFNLPIAWENSYAPFLSRFGYLVVLVAVVYVWYYNKWKADSRIIFLIYFLLTVTAILTFAALKVGSAENYFNDTLVVVVILLSISGVFFDKRMREWLFLVFIFVAAVLTITNFSVYTRTYIASNKNTVFEENLDKVSELLDDELGEERFFTKIRRLNLRFPDQCIFPQSGIVESSLMNKAKSYDYYKKLVDELDITRVKFVVIYQASPLVDLNNFEFYKSVGDIKVFINKQNLNSEP